MQPLTTTLSLAFKHTFFLFLLLSSVSAFAQFDMEAEPWRKSIYVRNAVYLNTENAEFSPTYYKDGIVFASDQKQHGPIDKQTGERYLELYYSKLDSNGDPSEPKEFSIELNSRLHEAATTFSSDKEQIYFTRNNQQGGFALENKKRVVQMKLYQADQGKFDWENVRELEFNGENFSCMHPTLSPAGDRMYFASDMPGEGARGDMDIYVVEWEGDGWGRPQNLGPKINTPAKEAFPFIHDSGVLFFASQGHNGIGGYDVYMVNLAEEEEETVINLGKPFNSVKDDFGFILSRDGQTGFFSSNRSEGKGRDDIYGFQALDGIKSMRKTFKLNTIVEVTDMDTGRPVIAASARVLEYKNGKLEEDIYDYAFKPGTDGSWNQEKTLKDEKLIRKDKKNTNQYGEAEYVLEAEKEYLILLTKPGYQPVEIAYSTIGKLEPERIRAEMQLQNCFDLLGIVRAPGYESLAFPSITITNKCNNEKRTIKANISGKFIYCLEPGCEFDLVANLQGYLASETSVSTVKIRGSRSLNIEMTLKPDPNYGQDVVVAPTAPANDDGYTPNPTAGRMETEMNTPTIRETAPPPDVNNSFGEPIVEGSVIVLENIYYELGEHKVADDAARELDELIRIMVYYPTMKIRMIAYTDVQGSYLDNLDLSDKRANAVKRYLKERGIALDRIDAIGLGESSPRNRCKNSVKCSDKEHAYNRRTEVHITEINKDVEFRRKDILQSKRPD